MSRKIEIFMREYGQVKAFNADHLPIIPGLFDASVLENCSTECLQEINRRVAETRQARSMTREEQRETLRKAADAARGYKLFREGDKTTTDVEIRRKDDGKGHNAFEIVAGEAPRSLPTAGPMDRSEAAFTNPHADSLFRNPATGVDYSRAEAYALAGGGELDRKLFRKMMQTDLKRLNSILAGS